MRNVVLWLVAALSAAAGCTAPLRLTRLQAAAHPPSNVAVFFAVDKADGAPVADLIAGDFRIYEDGKLVSSAESRQTIVDPQLAAAHYTLLLVDMSANATAGEQLSAVSGAVRAFIEQIEPYQRVALYAFDGSKNLYEVRPFTADAPHVARALQALAAFQARDPSTNLHGAVLQALLALDGALQSSPLPLRFGSLVVFTDGIDRANRVPFQQMVDAVDATEHQVYALGIGREIDDSTLARIGKTRYIRVDDSSAARNAFQELADRIIGSTRGHYLLSYCSPARTGKHVVSIEATAKGEHGRLDYEFDAGGFGPHCDASRPPPFADTDRTRLLREKLLWHEPQPTAAQVGALHDHAHHAHHAQPPLTAQ